MDEINESDEITVSRPPEVSARSLKAALITKRKERPLQTMSGAVVDLLDPHREQIVFADLVTALCRIPRFNGHTGGDTDQIYSVAQHSVLVSELVDQDAAFEALLHDIHEGLTGDITRPVQDAIASEKLAALQSSIQALIHKELGLQWPLSNTTSAVIKQADNLALAMEVRDLMQPGPYWSHLPEVPENAPRIIPLKPSEARELFVARFNALSQGTALSMINQEDVA